MSGAGRLYSGNTDDLLAAGYPRSTQFVKAGYMEKPLKGQWYLSGAGPCAYQAKGTLSTEYSILYPVDSRGRIYSPKIDGAPCPST